MYVLDRYLELATVISSKSAPTPEQSTQTAANIDDS